MSVVGISGRGQRVPVDEFASNTILKKKIKQKLLSIRWRFGRERRSVRVLMYRDRINAIRVEPRHIVSRQEVASRAATDRRELFRAGCHVPPSLLISVHSRKMESGEQSVVLPSSTLSGLSLSL